MQNEKISGMGFHHVALKAADFARALTFYTQGLGMRLYTMWGEDDHRGAMLQVGEDGIVELFAGGATADVENARYIHMAYRVEDVEAAYQTALAAGAVEKSAPRIVSLPSAPVSLTLQCAFVYGPCGEEIEFFRVLDEKNV